MQEFTLFDIIIISLTLLLGLKGFFRGIIKEAFGLIGIIGGIFVASRLSETIGAYIKPILNLENAATISLLGFVAGLIGFWLITYIIGLILSKVMSMSGLGIIDRSLGFVFGAAKIFLIFSVITYAVFQVNAFKSLLEKSVSNTISFPILVKTGAYIMKLDTSAFAKTVEDSVDVIVPKQEGAKSTVEKMEEITNSAKQKVEESTNEIIETEIKKSVSEMLPQSNTDVQSIKEEMNSQVTEKIETTKDEKMPKSNLEKMIKGN